MLEIECRLLKDAKKQKKVSSLQTGESWTMALYGRSSAPGRSQLTSCQRLMQRLLTRRESSRLTCTCKLGAAISVMRLKNSIQSYLACRLQFICHTIAQLPFLSCPLLYFHPTDLLSSLTLSRFFRFRSTFNDSFPVSQKHRVRY